MEAQVLTNLGLNETQAKAYLALVEHPSLTPPQLASAIKMARTNAYELLNQLTELQLADKEEVGKKLSFRAKPPIALKNMLLRQQVEIKGKTEQLNGLLPELMSTYRLTQDQPGVMTLEGVQGLEMLFDDIIRQGEEVLILPSAHDRDNPEISTAIDQQIARQTAAKIPVRTLYPVSDQLSPETIAQLKKQLISVRYADVAELPSQIMIYGQHVALSTYRQGMITTVVTNPQIAQTLRLVFEVLWGQADDPAFPGKSA